MIIYLIIIGIIFIHIVFSYLRKTKFNSNVFNTKITRKKLSIDEITTINSMTEKNEYNTVLIVEDDVINRKILKAQLTSAKYNVLTAKNGKSALKKNK